MPLRRLTACLLASAVFNSCSAEPSPTATSADSIDWFPLAVHRGGDTMDALATGSLVITDRCVFIQRGGERLLVAFAEAPGLWTWNAASREIITTWGSRTVSFGNGDPIAIGGGAIPNPGDVVWVKPPNAECVTSPIWFAGGRMSEP